MISLYDRMIPFRNWLLTVLINAVETWSKFQTLESTNYRINNYPVNRRINCVIHWIEIYPVDSVNKVLEKRWPLYEGRQCLQTGCVKDQYLIWKESVEWDGLTEFPTGRFEATTSGGFSSEAMLLRPPYTSLKAILIYLSFSYQILSLFLCYSMINVNIIFMSVNRRYTEIAVIVYNAWGSV